MTKPDAPPTAAAKTRVPDSATPVRFRKLPILSIDTRTAIDKVATRETPKAGSIILTNGEKTNDLLIIESGTAIGYGRGRQGEDELRVAELGPGDIVGEDCFLDAKGQYLTVRAETDCSILRVGPLDLLELEGGDQYYDNLRAAVGIIVVQRLRAGTNAHVVALGRELEAEKTQRQFGIFFLYVLAILCIWMIVSNVIAQGVVDINVNSGDFLLTSSILLGLPTIIVMWKMKIPIEQLGITLKRFRKSALEGLFASAVVVALIVVASMVLESYGALPAQPRPFEVIGAAFYFFHTFLQEMVGRGVFQTSFQKFLGDKSGVRAVLVTAVIFSTVHIHLGITAVAVAFSGSVLFGLLYLRHYNLAGVTLLHFSAGSAAFLMGTSKNAWSQIPF